MGPQGVDTNYGSASTAVLHNLLLHKVIINNFNKYQGRHVRNLDYRASGSIIRHLCYKQLYLLDTAYLARALSKAGFDPSHRDLNGIQPASTAG